MPKTRQDITQLLFDSRSGDPAAMSQLLEMVYADLHRLASRQLAGEGAEMTLSATALVNEAYLRLLSQTGGSWNDRQHFFRLISRAMRRISVDHARRRLSKKRGGDQQRVDLDVGELGQEDRMKMVLEVEDALAQLGKADERLVRLIECRFFAGLTEAETATTLECSRRTVQRDWERAKVLLMDLLAP